VLAAFSDARPCRSKTLRPAGEVSRAEATRLRGAPATTSSAERVVNEPAVQACLAVAGAGRQVIGDGSPCGDELLLAAVRDLEHV
jgi:hypothetical protein